MVEPTDKIIDIGFQMHVRRWHPEIKPGPHRFLLVHGLSSNARTWDAIGSKLAENGFEAVAVDQRGHGLSDKLSDGYDFDSITDDLRRLIESLGWEKPILVGQSWGGNVMLAFGARYPGVASGFVWVDGGFLNVGGDGESWDSISQRLMPPAVDGVKRSQMKSWIMSSHPNWDDAGIEATLANFETLPDGTLRRRLPLDNHMEIVRHLFDQKPLELYQQLTEPVLIAVAGDKAQDDRKRKLIQDAQLIRHLEVHWFDADHDIHVHKPTDLYRLIVNWSKRITV